MIDLSDGDELLYVPCGKCEFCLINKRDDWSFRLMQEYKAAKSAAFITLTYSDKFLPETGLSKRHFQLFMKRLRKKSGERLRYYAVGEYGTKTGRAHYHAIVFNFQGNESFLKSAWSTREGEPYGLVHIGKVNEASIRYTTKYVIQRLAHTSKVLNPPFALMSRSYGLGANYLTDEMVEWHRGAKRHHDSSPATARNYTMVNGKKGRLPRYYKNIIWPLESVRKAISDSCRDDALVKSAENFKFLLDQGYNPYAIMTEMRNAVISRVREKVAFTQTF